MAPSRKQNAHQGRVAAAGTACEARVVPPPSPVQKGLLAAAVFVEACWIAALVALALLE